MNDELIPKATEARKRFFWSARTLRVTCLDVDGFDDETYDILGVDQHRCIHAYDDYGPLIVRLLDEHFAKVSDA